MTNAVHEFNERVTAVEKLAEHLQQFVVPVFLRDAAGNAEQFGTGFFVTKDHDTFFVSAAHVLDELEMSDRTVCFYAEPAKFRNLGGTGLSTPLPACGYRRNDRFDVAVLRMSGEGLPPYPLVGKMALPYETLSQGPPARNGDIYVLIGFPASKSEVNRTDKTQLSAYWPIATTSIPTGEYKRHRLELGAHFVMPWNKRKILGRDMKRVNPYKLEGMSGSPLFRILDDGEEGADRGIEVAGVFIEHRRGPSILVATTAAIVVDMIAKLNTDRPPVPRRVGRSARR